MGDSITNGHGLDSKLRWTSLLASRLDIEVSNHGVSGDTTGGMVRYTTGKTSDQSASGSIRLKTASAAASGAQHITSFGKINVNAGVADESGNIGFLSWVPFEFIEGDLIKLNNISVRKFRDTPEINISNDAKIELYIDNSFPDMVNLSKTSVSSISDLRNGMRDISIILQITSWEERTFTSEDGTERIVRSGDVMDPTGRCRLTAWCDFNPKVGDYIQINSARAQFWQGSPDLVVDDLEQITNVSNPPWDDIDPSNHWVEVDIDDLSNGGSRRGISVSGTIVSVRKDSGIIYRCTKCRRVLRDDACSEHGMVEGIEDIRLRFVLDNGVSNASLLLSKEPSELFLQQKSDEIKSQISSLGPDGFINNLRNSLLSKKVNVKGRALIDAQGTMILAEEMQLLQNPVKDEALRIMNKWGVEL
jgi:replication factor A1